MHFLMSLVFLLITIVLMSIYAFVPVGLMILIRTFRRRYVHFNKLSEEQRPTNPPAWFENYDKKIVAVLLVGIVLFTVSQYVQQRNEWMGKDNTNLQAKEYFVAGQVLDFYRSVATRFLHPENVLLAPLNGLQVKIYETGRKYLPENDGEIGVWTDLWLVYPYSKRWLRPRGFHYYTNQDKVAPMLVELLDKSWFAIESMATKPFADRQMYTQHYLRNFAGMAHYYVYYDKGYTPMNSGQAFYLSKKPEFVERSRRLIDWLMELKANWRKSQPTLEFLRKNPEVEAFRLTALAMSFGDLLLGRINADDFTCKDPYWATYQDVRQEFVSDGNRKSPLDRMADKKQAEKMSYVALSSVAAKFDWNVLRKYCGIELAGEIDWSPEKRWARTNGRTLNQQIEHDMKTVRYTGQIRKLEGKFDGD